MRGEQLDQLATPGAGFRDSPLHELLADAPAAAVAGDADVLEQAARGALRAQSRQDAELQAADPRALALFRDHQLDIWSLSERLEREEIGRRQRVLEPFARAAERIVRQHRHDDADIAAARAPNRNRGNC